MNSYDSADPPDTFNHQGGKQHEPGKGKGLIRLLVNDSPATADASWRIVVRGFQPLQERAAESLLALGNGYIGTRASLAEGNPASEPGTFIAGVFNGFGSHGPIPQLVTAPNWLSLSLTIAGEPLRLDSGDALDHERQLDMWRGLWTRDWRHCDRAGRITRLRFLQCVSLADRHALVQRLEITPENYTAEITIEAQIDAQQGLQPEIHSDLLAGADRVKAQMPVANLEVLQTEGSLVEARTVGSGITMAFASQMLLRTEATASLLDKHREAVADMAWNLPVKIGSTYRFERLVSVHTSRDESRPMLASKEHLRSLIEIGAEKVIEAHQQAWSRRWRTAGIKLEGDPAIAQALHLASYHLIGSANPEDEHVSIGARGLTGQAYRGHVFWDTEIFMLPFFICTEPDAARSLLMYRFHTLPAAKEKASRLGYRGALYAWESTDSGEEATPAEVIQPDGEVVPILCGISEHHISADIAYAVWQYWRATGDDAFFLSAGAEVMLETSRFWASRASIAADGRYHIRDVIGPDEYHESVDDNAYTNLMARWNLRRGQETALQIKKRWPSEWRRLAEHLELTGSEVESWGRIAGSILDGMDEDSGVIEQFAGYHSLDEVDLATYEPRTMPMDMLLGHDRIRQTKVLKQADVVMALALLWEEFSPQARKANFNYYEPRTAHGSSLSPGIHAETAARLGNLELAQHYLRQTAAIDLDDQLVNAAGGMHMAALGSLWRAIVFGFGGVELLDDRLVLRPLLAPKWQSLGIPFCWRGRRLYLEVHSQPPSCELSLESGDPLIVVGDDESQQELTTATPFVGKTLGRRWELREESQG